MTEVTERPDMDRRRLVSITAATLAGVTIAPGVVLQSLAGGKTPNQGVSSQVRWGMLIDTNKCADGCSACVEACNRENAIPSHGRPTTDPQWIRKVKLRDKMTGRVANLPMMCQHCEFPPCVDVCPTGASFRRTDGIVMVDRHTCIGCRYCMMACPYKARSFIHENIEEHSVVAPRGKGCVESCNFCAYWLDRGAKTTACAQACAKAGHQAIIFGDLNDPESAIAKRLRELPTRQIRSELELNTGVRYAGV